MNVDFGSNNITGDAKNFFEYFSFIASPTTGNSVSGNLALSGSLDAMNNTTIGGGIAGTATGNVDGTNLNMTMTGNMTGLTADSLILYFNGANGNGVGYAVE